jgi:hypothetical protein
MAMKHALTAVALGVMACAGLAAASGADDTRTVARWPYRAFLDGLDALDKGRNLAPDGVLSFTLQPAAAQADKVGVALDGKAGQQALPRDGMRFTLPRIDRFDRRDTLVIVTAADTRSAPDAAGSDPAEQEAVDKLGHLPLAHVRTPGLPDKVFRLGDLRLACMVNVAVFKDQAPWWLNALITGVLRTSDWCDGAHSASVSPRAPRRFTALTMRDGAREKRLTFDKPRDQLPLPPLKQNWNDEALLTIEPEPDQ